MKINYPKTITLFLLLGVSAFLLFRSCSGCGKKETIETKTETTIDTTATVGNVTPEPVVQVPIIDSSIFEKIGEYRALWLAEKRRNDASAKELFAIKEALNDTSLSLLERYGLLQKATTELENELAFVKGNNEGLQKKLEEAANGTYITEGVDSSDSYRLEYRIFSRGPLLKDGFNRKITTYEKTVATTETITKTTYPSLFVGAMYGLQPDARVYSLLVGKDWGKFGLISQMGMTDDLEVQLGVGVKYNF